MPTRQHIAPALIIVVMLSLLSACRPGQPLVIREDPNQERQERMQIQTEESNIEGFIASHSELDEPTKRGLRDGTVSRDEALARLKTPRP